MQNSSNWLLSVRIRCWLTASKMVHWTLETCLSSWARVWDLQSSLACLRTTNHSAKSPLWPFRHARQWITLARPELALKSVVETLQTTRSLSFHPKSEIVLINLIYLMMRMGAHDNLSPLVHHQLWLSLIPGRHTPVPLFLDPVGQKWECPALWLFFMPVLMPGFSLVLPLGVHVTLSYWAGDGLRLHHLHYPG